jgi:hypothetical protein
MDSSRVVHRSRTNIRRCGAKFARNLVSIEPLATGHYIQEQMPAQCLERFFKFFVT